MDLWSQTQSVEVQTAETDNQTGEQSPVSQNQISVLSLSVSFCIMHHF